MHLLLAQPGQADPSEAVDLGQSPAEVIVISAADTELAALAEARAELGPDAPGLRLASLLHLAHPMSVDLYLDRTATRARLVIARVLGGESYWTYGIEQFTARLAEAGVAFAALPGDDKPDPGLSRISSVAAADYEALWAYLVEGGPENAANFLRHARWMLDPDGTEPPPPARPLLRAGLYWPGAGTTDLAAVRAAWPDPAAPVVPLVFYRALVAGAGLHPINRLVRALMAEGLNPLPVFVASLKDPVSQGTLESLFAEAPPAVILNATSFAVSSPQAGEQQPTVLDRPGVPVLQVVLSGGTEEQWEKGTAGLSARDIAMNVALPEVDGRILSRAVSFKGEAFFDEATQCRITAYRARGDRVSFVARLAAAWARLRRERPERRRVAVILANYPNRDGRLANGVGLDTPESCVGVLAALKAAGYGVEGAPTDSATLMARIQAGPTNWLADRAARSGGARLSLAAYQSFYGTLPWELRRKVEERWGHPQDDPFFAPGDLDCGGFALSILDFGHVVVGVQPARGYNIDPVESYHAPDLVPPHNYLAFYAWLREEFGAHAIVHLGKHGNLEWLPGKAVALSENCFPEAALGPMPHLYPFIVNDPGEGTQAKRRAQAVIIDHLTPPLTRAETYGPLRQLEALVDEYYEASGVDPRRLDHLRREIRSLVSAARLDLDAGITPDMAEDEALNRLDTYLCELKEAQIRDGLHVFGRAPDGGLERDLAIALVRVPRGDGKGGNASLIRALARDCGIDPESFDALDCDMGAPWEGPRHKFLHAVATDPWRTQGDTVERLEALAQLAIQWPETPRDFRHTAPVLEALHGEILPAIRACGQAEMAALMAGLDGRFVPPGPSGAPTRGRPDVLPTGRNFFSVDSRAVPTPAAFALGWHSASLLVERHVQEHGDWLRAVVLTAWGTANMRTGGDDIAQGLALMGVRPTWDQASRRVTGFEIVPLAHLDRPRVDVTLRVSGFFRDAFPAQMALFDAAARAVMALDEPEEMNPLAARFRADRARLAAGGMPEDDAATNAGYRVFGSKPGAYGAGLQAMLDEHLWERRADLAESYVNWGAYAYAREADGVRARDAFETRLTAAEAVVQNQDNREHDLLDSDDYYQFEGGAAAAVEHLSGRAPAVYHNDHSRPERPVIRTLEDEIGRVVRSRVVNPKWLAGVRRHGYKGAFEIAATVDYLFAFAATTHAVRSHHFDLVHEAVIEDDEVRGFIAEANPAALSEIAARLSEAIDRDLWQPRSNSARAMLAELRGET
ncbi:cobaltochelatase subunit CobN [Limibaculum sp. FT325]|uniref:cobaltochelatase subunit CobN n=1 Tax=Thermohalobaculum sediminis TaxID=2939436 RepID=UPI0020BEC542|nr:cobaltochelatase subunit CobN [Limibaculum sediminis]MCL5775625.1 cobaltochelatase subunit CobN [Limibaculum sediminis]